MLIMRLYALTFLWIVTVTTTRPPVLSSASIRRIDDNSQRQSIEERTQLDFVAPPYGGEFTHQSAVVGAAAVPLKRNQIGVSSFAGGQLIRRLNGGPEVTLFNWPRPYLPYFRYLQNANPTNIFPYVPNAFVNQALPIWPRATSVASPAVPLFPTIPSGFAGNTLNTLSPPPLPQQVSSLNGTQVSALMGNRFTSISSRINDSQIRSEVKEHPIVMYTKTSCSYCKKAKTLLSEEQIPYEEKNLDVFNSHFPDRYKEYVNGLVYVTHQTSVPQVFICGNFIGGFTELNSLKVAGRLKDAVEECRAAFEVDSTKNESTLKP